MQTAYLATHWNPIYWNTACLIVNSGALATTEDEDMDWDDDEDIAEKNKGVDYVKTAIALNEIRGQGVQVSLANINKSAYGFKPDAANNTILYGLKGITRVGVDVIKDIIANRPYTSLEDFMSKVKIGKLPMINLIKAGAFDEIEKKTREEVMEEYLHIVDDEKKRLTLQNFNGLINAGLVPTELDKVVQIYQNTKRLKKDFKDNDNFVLSDEEILKSIEDSELLTMGDDGYYRINQKMYDKVIYQKEMDKARAWLRNNHDEILAQFNKQIYDEIYEKYCGLGNISAWEMDSLSFYYHDHELKNVNKEKYGIVDFKDLSEQPEEEYSFIKNGKHIPIYQLHRIVGTVIGKNKTKGTIHLLTTNGVVLIRFRKEMFALYDKIISERRPDGTKKTIEKSWFTKGNKLMITGFRRDDQFVPKRYAKTPGHTLYLITDIENNGDLSLQSARVEE